MAESGPVHHSLGFVSVGVASPSAIVPDASIAQCKIWICPYIGFTAVMSRRCQCDEVGT